MKAKELYEIAEEEDLRTVSTTEAMNGYPLHVREAITGFDSWEQAEELAQQYGLQIVLLTQMYGWDLWYSRGWINKEPELTPEDLDYMCILRKNFDEEDFCREFINRQEGCECTIEDIVTEAQRAQEVSDAAKYLDEGEVVFYNRINGGAYDYEVVKEHPMAWHSDSDSRRYCVALVENND